MVPMHLGCAIPLADDPDKVIIPKGRTPDKIVQNLSYIRDDEINKSGPWSTPLFGGHQSWLQRDESFKLKPTMKVYNMIS